MAESDDPLGGPAVETLDPVFAVSEVRRENDRLVYLGEPAIAPAAVERKVWPLFREHGYEVHLTTVTDGATDPITGVDISTPRQALIAEPRSLGIDGIPWNNLIFAMLTLVTTLYAGVRWYGIENAHPLAVLQTWPFAVAVLGVLGVHELGHYVMSRYHRVHASLPYFIPVPTIFGTMGAVIKMKGRIPSRKALFDIGVAGPLAGLLAAIIVTTIGLQLDPVAVDGPIYQITGLNYPPLIQLIAMATGESLTFTDGLWINPVVVGGWVGMFITFLNLLPVGQLDGGHLMRAMIGQRQETIGVLVPAALFLLGGYLLIVRAFALEAVFLWFFWGIITTVFAYAGPAHPMREEPLDTRRMALGIGTFVLGVGCFTPVPFELV
ncbi:site-2 protease family protein [Halocatena halophila]|uniref:site-2 protease family protein n=1 Tax=Halocatena halophila TaxID=2814576 RepID=UPI002ED36E82